MHGGRSHGTELIVVDLFSGPGGLSLGFKQARFKIAIGIERDRYAARTFERNFPEAVVILDEVEKIGGEDLLHILDNFSTPRKIVLVGGPPCQPFSSANMHLKNRGREHPLASSVDHFARILREVKPDAFLFENVGYFENIDHGRSMRALTTSIHNLGYSVSTSKLEAQNFGIPQHRRRLFLGGMRPPNGFNLPPSQAPAPAQFDGHGSPSVVSVRDAISDLPPLPSRGGGSDVGDYDDDDSKDLCTFQRTSRRGSPRLFNHWSSRHSAEVSETIKHIRPGLSLTLAWKDLPRRIRSRYGNKKSIQNNIYRRLTWRGISPTIVHPRRAMLLHPSQRRILSVREAARLQSFPDKFRFLGTLDSQYQQVANAVPPALAKSLAIVYRSELLKNQSAEAEGSHNRIKFFSHQDYANSLGSAEVLVGS